MKITISGIVGSGKSTVSKMVAKKLGLQNFSVGGIMRQMAIERGVSLQELTEIAKHDKEIDFELDKRQRDLNNNEDFVMDSRLGFYFIPDSFKVFLRVDLQEAAKRIYGDNRSEENYADVEECLSFLKKRVESENIRYKKFYNIEFPSEESFDLIIDTTNKMPEEVVDEILKSVPKKGHYKNKS